MIFQTMEIDVQTRKEKQTIFPIFVPKLYTDIKKDDRRWFSLAITTVF